MTIPKTFHSNLMRTLRLMLRN